MSRGKLLAVCCVWLVILVLVAVAWKYLIAPLWEEAGLPATLAGIAASLSLTAVDPVVAITKLSIDGGRDMLGIVRPAKTGSTEIIIPSTIVKQLQVAEGGTNRDGTKFVNVNVTMYQPSEKVAEGQEEPGELPPLPSPAPGE